MYIPALRIATPPRPPPLAPEDTPGRGFGSRGHGDFFYNKNRGRLRVVDEKPRPSKIFPGFQWA